MTDLRSRLPMGVRMIPEQRGALFDLEAWRPGLARLDRLMRTSIRARGQMESVPVKRRRFREPVRDIDAHRFAGRHFQGRSEEHTPELQSLMRISYAVFCLKKKKLINLIHIITSQKPTYHPSMY